MAGAACCDAARAVRLGRVGSEEPRHARAPDRRLRAPHAAPPRLHLAPQSGDEALARTRSGRVIRPRWGSTWHFVGDLMPAPWPPTTPTPRSVPASIRS